MYFAFCKENKIEEADFYNFFGSLDALSQDIWVKFFENTAASYSKR